MGSPKKRIQYRYDSVGNRVGMTDPDGGRFTYTYDAVNRITQVINPQGDRTSYAYDAGGRRTVKKLANGTRASFSYDAASNLTRLANLKSDGTTISSFNYDYDRVGNRTAVLEADGSRVTWTYDDTYQLTGEHRTGTTPYEDSYSYDASGNRLLKIHDGARTTYSYDAANQLEWSEDASGRTTYTFDADGNQQLVVEPTGDRTTTSWDYENRTTLVQLPSGIRNTMAYEPGGLRMKLEESTGTKKFVWDEQNYLAETDENDDTQVVYTNEPRVYGNLVSQRRGTERHWYHFDAIGSTRELTDSGEIVTDTRLYDAWGAILDETGSDSTRFQYVGAVGYFRDAESGPVYYVRARSLDPAPALWLSRDPIWRDEPTGAYVYSKQNPTTLADPSGLDPNWNDHVFRVSCLDEYCQPHDAGSLNVSSNWFHTDRNSPYAPGSDTYHFPNNGIGIAMHFVASPGECSLPGPCCCDRYEFIQVIVIDTDPAATVPPSRVDGGSPACPYYGCNPVVKGAGPPPTDRVRTQYPPGVVKDAPEVCKSLYDRPFNPTLHATNKFYNQLFITCLMCVRQPRAADTIMDPCVFWGWGFTGNQPTRKVFSVLIEPTTIPGTYGDSFGDALRREYPDYLFQYANECADCTC